MNKKIPIILVALLAFGAPSVSQAAFTFGSVSTDQLYFSNEQNSVIVSQTRMDPIIPITPPTWATCEYEAAQAGLSESSNYWCVQKAVLGSFFENNCVFLCLLGEGSGTTYTPVPASMTTYIFSASPVGRPLSYYTSANPGQQNALNDLLMCLTIPSFGYGCELKKHTPVNAAPTVTMSANPSSIISGASSALTWSSTNTTSCSLDQSIGGVATTGTRSVSPTVSTTYTITCTGAGGSASDTETITVGAGLATASLSATPASVTSGSASSLSWSSTNATKCVGTGFDTLGAISGSVSTGALSATTNYSVTCTGPSTGSTLGTWQFVESDVSDLSCPITGGTNVYSAVPNCPSNPNGKTCNTNASNDCKVNVVSNGANCVVTTSLYQCRGPGITPGSSASASATVAVTALPQPDLTAGVVSPSTATEDSPVTLSSSALNSGAAAAGAFPNIFQIENGPLVSANAPTSLATGASAPLSASYTFTSAGTYRVRACVDNNTAWAGSVAESNEGNNCGEYTTITVNACSGVGCTGYTGTLSCSVNNANPLVGQTVVYTATPGGGATGPYIWTASDGATGLGTGATASRTFSSPGVYTMNVSSATGANASCSPQVSVGCGSASASISASPTRVTKGSTATLTVPALSGVDTTCTVTGPGVSRTLTASSCSVAGTSFPTGPITTLSTYTISCDNETTAKVIVNVVPAVEEF